MIQHDDGLRLCQQLFAFGIIRLAGVDHDDGRFVANHIDGLTAGHEHLLLVIRVVEESGHQGLNGGRRIVDDDVDRLADGLARDINADRRSQGIDIRNLMSHDQDHILAGHDFPQGMRLDTGFDPVSFFNGFRLASEVRRRIAVLDDDLISAAPQCQLDGCTGRF